MSKWIYSFFYLFFPPCCVVCGRVLQKPDMHICLKCNLALPRTHYHLRKENPIERIFWGKIPIKRATSLFFYQPESPYQNILYQLKYKGRKEIGITMGRILASEIQDTGFFDSVDTIIPLPLHPKKKDQRGYNQSEWIAKGIREITHIPIDNNSIVRTKDTTSQTKKSRIARLENVNNIFSLLEPKKFTGKHVLIIDDVLTTGASIEACASVFKEVPDIRISILTLAVAD